MGLVANARMYGLTPGLRDAWGALFAWISGRAGVPLAVIDHAAPAPLEALWRRDDLGLAFMCGLPFTRGEYAVVPVAAPVPSSTGRSAYASDLVVRAHDDAATLPDTFGRRIGWTVEHSQSGFNALRFHLLAHRSPDRPQLFSASVGPLVTPRRVIEALLAGEIDLGPLDSYAHDLLKAEDPETAARLRVVATTSETPMPLLVASAGVDGETIERSRAALLAASAEPRLAPVLSRLRLQGFAAVERSEYRVLLDQAAAAEAAGYVVPI
ncbi:MAG TPA: PhnD/SsuA/transferrin family substrate-binding protein [Beijerinckiaceae bacterium]|jgi:ABC-type phosphate/phosphonate transport system substrate-binding protein